MYLLNGFHIDNVLKVLHDLELWADAALGKDENPDAGHSLAKIVPRVLTTKKLNEILNKYMLIDLWTHIAYN